MKKYTWFFVILFVYVLLNTPYTYSYSTPENQVENGTSTQITEKQTIESNTLPQKTLEIPLSCRPYLKYVERYDWDIQTAINVAYAESSCNPEAVNLNPNTEKHKSKLYRDYPKGYCIGSFGLFQTSCTWQIYYDPELNVALAYKIYTEQGWSAWTTTCTLKVKC